MQYTFLYHHLKKDFADLLLLSHYFLDVERKSRVHGRKESHACRPALATTRL